MEETKKCISALLAAMEVLRERCSGEEGTYRALTEELWVHVPKEFMEEFERETGHKLGNPITDENLRKKAIEACMRAAWASRLAEKMVGAEAPEEVKEMMKRKLCEHLIG